MENKPIGRRPKLRESEDDHFGKSLSNDDDHDGGERREKGGLQDNQAKPVIPCASTDNKNVEDTDPGNVDTHTVVKGYETKKVKVMDIQTDGNEQNRGTGTDDKNKWNKQDEGMDILPNHDENEKNRKSVGVDTKTDAWNKENHLPIRPKGLPESIQGQPKYMTYAASYSGKERAMADQKRQLKDVAPENRREEYSDDEYEPTDRRESTCKPSVFQRDIRREQFGTLFRVALVIGIVVLIASVILQSWSIKKEAELVTSVDTIETEIGRLRQQFPDQHEELWNIVGACVEDVLFNPHPAKPAVLLMASFADGARTMHCLVQALSKTLANLLGSDSFYIELSGLDMNNPGQAKFELDEKLRGGFESGRSLVLLRDLHVLPGEVAILLHMYADNQNAPYKKAIIISLCQVMQDVSETRGEKNLDPFQWDAVVSDFLSQKWSPFQGESKAQALITRLAYNVVFVYPSKIKTQTC